MPSVYIDFSSLSITDILAHLDEVLKEYHRDPFEKQILQEWILKKNYPFPTDLKTMFNKEKLEFFLNNIDNITMEKLEEITSRYCNENI